MLTGNGSNVLITKTSAFPLLYQVNELIYSCIPLSNSLTMPHHVTNAKQETFPTAKKNLYVMFFFFTFLKLYFPKLITFTLE